MNVCFFGSYNAQYSRNNILIDGLRKNGITVFHCNSTQPLLLFRYSSLFFQFLKIAVKTDVLFVAFVGQFDMPIAWVLAKVTGKKLVFDMFYSMFDTYVFDRKSFNEKALFGRIYFWIDKLAGHLADIIITDTRSHADYFAKIFKIKRNKFHTIFVGGDDTIFKKNNSIKQRKKIIIEFHGMFTRLQGAEYFVEAAKQLENEKNIEFWLIGGSKIYMEPMVLYKKLVPKNMVYTPQLTPKILAEKISRATISVGHLGVTQKAKNVITNKMYHAINLGIALIAPRSSATKELFKNKETALFVKMGDSNDLVLKIRELVRNKKLRETIAQNGFLLSQKMTNKFIAQRLIRVIEYY